MTTMVQLGMPLGTYTWRGKTYKTVMGILRAAANAYPGVGGNFSADAMCLRYRDGRTLHFARTFDAAGNSIVANDAA